MPACHGHSIDGLVPQFISELLKLRRTQLTEIFRSFNPVEKGSLGCRQNLFSDLARGQKCLMADLLSW